jgi:hypothetical protein
VRLISSERVGHAERVLALRRAGVKPLVFTGEVEAPVFLEVAVG